MPRLNSTSEEQIFKRILHDNQNRKRKSNRKLGSSDRQREELCESELFGGNLEVIILVIYTIAQH